VRAERHALNERMVKYRTIGDILGTDDSGRRWTHVPSISGENIQFRQLESVGGHKAARSSVQLLESSQTSEAVSGGNV
jgi:hypothetical protein